MSKVVFDLARIESMEKVERLHLMNSITGVKPANLIASIDEQGRENVAVFSSVVHLGSAPALLGFVLRPSFNGNRHTYENIKQMGVYSINAVTSDTIAQAHYSSARFARDVSEFSQIGLHPEYREGFAVPFVQESPVQIGMRFVDELYIEANQTRMIIGAVESVAVDEQGLDEKLLLNLEALGLAGIAGLSSYYQMQRIAEFNQAEVGEFPRNIL